MPLGCRGHILLIAIFLCAAVPRPAAAKIEIEAEAGFANTFVSGSWTPLRALVQNLPDPQHPESAPRDFKGQVRATVIGNDGQSVQYLQDLELPGHSRKSVELSILVPSNNSPLLVELVDTKGRIVAKTEVKFGGSKSSAEKRGVARVFPTVLVENDPNEAVGFPSTAASATNIQRLDLSQFPSDPKDYSQVRVILIRGRISSKLNEDQLAALDEWIQFGGQLVVTTPRYIDELKLDTWLGPRLPASLESVREVHLDEIIEGEKSESALLTQWGDTKPDAKIIWNSKAGPIAITRLLGLGGVTAFALDTAALTGSALAGPVGKRTQQILDALVLLPRTEDLRARHAASTGNVEPYFNVVLLPNRIIVMLILVVFVIMVGPANFYILRKRRRLELAWVTIPALSITFFIAVYIFGVFTKGSKQFYATAEILHLTAGKPRGLILWAATQFSPADRNYQFSGPPGAVILPFAQYYDIPNYGGFLANLGAGAMGLSSDPKKPGLAYAARDHGYTLLNPVGQWKLAYYQGERPIEIEGNIDGKVILQKDGGAIVEVANDTGARLQSASVFVGKDELKIGEIPPRTKICVPFDSKDNLLTESFKSEPLHGEQIPITGSADTAKAGERNMTADEQFTLSVFKRVSDGAFAGYPMYEKFHPQRRCRLIARQDLWRSEVKIDPGPDIYKTAGLVEVQLPIEIKGSMMFRRASDLTLEVYDYDPQNTSFFNNEGELCTLNQGWAEFVMSPPPLTNKVEFRKGTIIIYYAGSSEWFVVKVFNARKGVWEDVQETRSGPNQSGQSKITFEIKPEHLNHYGNFARLRLESREPPNQPASGRNFAYASGNVIQVQEIAGELSFEDSNTEASAAGDSPQGR